MSFCHLYDTEDYLRYAHGLISEYISEDLSKALLRHLQYVQISNPNTMTVMSSKLWSQCNSRFSFSPCVTGYQSWRAQRRQSLLPRYVGALVKVWNRCNINSCYCMLSELRWSVVLHLTPTLLHLHVLEMFPPSSVTACVFLTWVVRTFSFTVWGDGR